MNPFYATKLIALVVRIQNITYFKYKFLSKLKDIKDDSSGLVNLRMDSKQRSAATELQVVFCCFPRKHHLAAEIGTFRLNFLEI